VGEAWKGGGAYALLVSLRSLAWRKFAGVATKLEQSRSLCAACRFLKAENNFLSVVGVFWRAARQFQRQVPTTQRAAQRGA